MGLLPISRSRENLYESIESAVNMQTAQLYLLQDLIKRNKGQIMQGGFSSILITATAERKDVKELHPRVKCSFLILESILEIKNFLSKERRIQQN